MGVDRLRTLRATAYDVLEARKENVAAKHPSPT